MFHNALYTVGTFINAVSPNVKLYVYISVHILNVCVRDSVCVCVCKKE